MVEGQGIWLYAVTRRLGPGAPGEPAGVSGETPRMVEAGELAAVVGDVPLARFGEEALRRNLEDLDWLGAAARVHDAVIGALVARGPVVPVRLATVYHDDDRVRQLLRDRAQEFERALAHVTGRTEWGVKVFLEAEPAPAEQAASRQEGGAAYLARRRAALTSGERRQRRAAEQADRVHALLATLSADARTHPPQSRTLTGVTEPMILNAAYLVDGDGARWFAEAVEACDRNNDAIRVQLTGPWPPYSFSSWEET